MVHENVENVRQRIAEACRRCGRQVDEVTLIAVTKTFNSATIREALGAGIRDIGENFVQEFRQKYNEIPGENVRWHFIGHLQRNKVKEVVGRTALIHSVDSLRLGEALARRAEDTGSTVEILVEVNTSGEDTKFGVAPEETGALIRGLAAFPHLRIRGLMTIGPFLPDPESSRPAFRTLRLLRDSVVASGIGPDFDMPYLSMGMSNDFEVAIEEGATHVRLGTVLFGKRTKAT